VILELEVVKTAEEAVLLVVLVELDVVFCTAKE
jgi:hypothetical protein